MRPSPYQLTNYSILLALLPAFAFGQSASLSGRILDESGAFVPAASITLKGSAAAKSAIAAADGTYSFIGLAAGDYMLTARAPQLATAKPIRVSLKANATIQLDVTLLIVTKSEEVSVSDQGAPTISLDASSNAGAVVIQGSDLDALADDPEDLAADLQALAGPAAGPNGGSIFIDGFSGGQLPPKESIREIRINSNPFSPEYDKLGFGRVEIFTKPGANKFKGDLGYNYQGDFWNSRNPYASAKAPLQLNEFENSVTGPLGHKTSFTLNLERHAVDNGYISNGIRLDPVTLLPTPFNTIFRTPQRRFFVTPRIDRTLNDKNTLIVRYTFITSDVNGAGIGGFDLTSRGYDLNNHFNTVQVSNTLALSSIINETRFQYFRTRRLTDPASNDPALQVIGAFTSGGASAGNSLDVQNSYELQNYTSAIRGRHTLRFGARLRELTDDSTVRTNFNGTYVFTSIDTYRQTLAGVPGFGPSQFSITAGTPTLSAKQFDIGLFAGDDFRITPRVTLNYGLRYETQTNISDWKDFAPRFGAAWAPGKAKNSKTVIRVGSGFFYDRFSLANTMTALRYNGSLQQQYVFTQPTFFPAIPSLAGVTSSVQTIQKIDSHLRAPYIIQSAVSVERQLSKTVTLSTTYTNSHGLHMLRSEVLKAPAPVFLAESTALYNQNQLIANVSAKPIPQVSVFGYYVLNKAMSNSDGLGTFPANPASSLGEYAPAATDIRHRGLIGGSLSMKWNIRMSPYLTMNSGPPFDITTGQDLYGTTLLNSRPGLATAPGPGIIATSYGLLDPHPTAGETILPRNYGRGPGAIQMNLRIGKTIGIGPRKEEAANKANAGPAKIDAANLSAPGGMRGLFSPAASDRKYSLNISMSGRNILNHNNPGPIIGSIASPLFGRANQIAGGPNGEGFSENASNRRLELQIKFSF